MFQNIGETLKKVSKILFFVSLAIGVIAVIVGLFIFISGTDSISFAVNRPFLYGLSFTPENKIPWDEWQQNCYCGELIMKFGFMSIIFGLIMLPTYAIGEIVVYLKKMSGIKTDNIDK